MKLDEHLFRRESGRLVVALTRVFGVHNLALVEDVVQDALCRALEVWKFSGPPENPTAWLMTTAKNRALDVLRRERTRLTFAPELGRLLETEWTLASVVEEHLGAAAIKDETLHMMFVCCQPPLPEVAQVALVLNLICGFGTGEIASAFLSTPAAMERRIERAKNALVRSKVRVDLQPGQALSARLPAVLRVLYLLFNEGYHGNSPEAAVRAELCEEGMRLSVLLLDHAATATPATHALAAMMCLHACRLPARVDGSGNLTTLFNQDRSAWDPALKAEGLRLLDLSASGSEVSEYHVEAAIASVHAQASSAEDTNWDQIVSLYDTLLTLRPSPVVALSRAIAVAQRDGPVRGLEEMRTIDGQERLARYPFYEAALGELQLRLGNPGLAAGHFRTAARLARNPMEQRFLKQRESTCGLSSTPGRC